MHVRTYVEHAVYKEALAMIFNLAQCIIISLALQAYIHVDHSSSYSQFKVYTYLWYLQL